MLAFRHRKAPQKFRIMKFETDRLILRPFKRSDLAHIIEYGTVPDFYRYLPIDHQTEDTIRAFFAERMQDQKEGHPTRDTFAVTMKETDRIIGTIRLEILDLDNNTADIGYAMDLRFGGQGYMLEAVRRVLEYGYDERAIKTVWAVIHPDNVKSKKLTLRAGFHKTPPPDLPALLSKSSKDDCFYKTSR